MARRVEYIEYDQQNEDVALKGEKVAVNVCFCGPDRW